MNNKTNKNQNHSMFLYTALIFVVALLLIIIAFFGQTKKQKVDDIVESPSIEQATSAPTEESAEGTVTEAPTENNEPGSQPPPEQDDYAKLSNKVLELDNENSALKNKLSVYEQLLSANKAVTENDMETAQTLISQINADSLTDEQKILFDQITEKTNEGEE